MSDIPKGRKPVMQDIRVIAALQALKTAVLAVNGDKKVVSEIILFDVMSQEKNHSFLVLNMDFCACPACIDKVVDLLGDQLSTAAGQYMIKKQEAVH